MPAATHLEERNLPAGKGSPLDNAMPSLPREPGRASVEQRPVQLGRNEYNLPIINGVTFFTPVSHNEMNEGGLQDLLTMCRKDGIETLVIADTLPSRTVVKLATLFHEEGMRVIIVDHHSDDYNRSGGRREYQDNHEILERMLGDDFHSTTRNDAGSVAAHIPNGSLRSLGQVLYVAIPADLDGVISGLCGAGCDPAVLNTNPGLQLDTHRQLSLLDSPRSREAVEIRDDLRSGRAAPSEWIRPFEDALAIAKQFSQDWMDFTCLFAMVIQEGALHGGAAAKVFNDLALEGRTRLAILRSFAEGYVAGDSTSPFFEHTDTPGVICYDPSRLGETLEETRAALLSRKDEIVSMMISGGDSEVSGETFERAAMALVERRADHHCLPTQWEFKTSLRSIEGMPEHFVLYRVKCDGPGSAIAEFFPITTPRNFSFASISEEFPQLGSGNLGVKGHLRLESPILRASMSETERDDEFDSVEGRNEELLMEARRLVSEEIAYLVTRDLSHSSPSFRR